MRLALRILFVVIGLVLLAVAGNLLLAAAGFVGGGLSGEARWFLPFGLAVGWFAIACGYWSLRLIAGARRPDGYLTSPWTRILLWFVALFFPLTALLSLPLRFGGLIDSVAAKVALLASLAAAVFLLLALLARPRGET